MNDRSASAGSETAAVVKPNFHKAVFIQPLTFAFRPRACVRAPGTQAYPMPRECVLQVLGFTSEGAPVNAGTITGSDTQAPIYIKGDRVRVVPKRVGKVPCSGEVVPNADLTADFKEDSGPEEEDMQTPGYNPLQVRDNPLAQAPEAAGLSDNDAMPDRDADAKLERLPSNAPVLRPWGEAAGVERRWRSGSGASGGGDMDGMSFPGASYVSNAATVEVGDSDDSKDGSSNNNSPASSAGDRATWPRERAMDDVIATALPALTAISSENSEAPNRWTGEIATAFDGTVGESGSRPDDGPRRGVVVATDTEGRGPDGNSRDAIADDVRSERASTGSSRPRAFAGAKDLAEETLGGKEEACKVPPSRIGKWAVKVRAAAMPRNARLLQYLKQRLSLAPLGPSLEQAREWMREWTPEMDKSLLELLGAAGTKAVRFKFYVTRRRYK